MATMHTQFWMVNKRKRKLSEARKRESVAKRRKWMDERGDAKGAWTMPSSSGFRSSRSPSPVDWTNSVGLSLKTKWWQ